MVPITAGFWFYFFSLFKTTSRCEPILLEIFLWSIKFRFAYPGRGISWIAIDRSTDLWLQTIPFVKSRRNLQGFPGTAKLFVECCFCVPIDHLFLSSKHKHVLSAAANTLSAFGKEVDSISLAILNDHSNQVHPSDVLFGLMTAQRYKLNVHFCIGDNIWVDLLDKLCELKLNQLLCCFVVHTSNDCGLLGVVVLGNSDQQNPSTSV